MKMRCIQRRNGGMTLNEVLVVIVVLFILAAVLLPALRPHKHGGSYINCVNNLKQVGLAYRIWAGDNNDKYPMAVSITNGGTMELISTGTAWINFGVMSNELGSPKILHCPEDTSRTFATNFTTDLNNSKISYFVGLDADPAQPQMILSGDDNFAIGGVPIKSGLLELSTNAPIAWTAARHKLTGNLALADGSVQSATINGLKQALQSTGVATNRLAIP